MATIRRRNKKWQAQVRQKNYQSFSKTFTYKSDALQWAKETETGLQKNYLEFNSAQQPSFSKIIDKYINLISSYKRGADIEIIRLRALQKQSFTACLASIHKQDAVHFCDCLITGVSYHPN